MESISTDRRVLHKARSATDRRPDSAAKAAACPPAIHHDGFLSHSFPALYDRHFKDHKKVEQAFFNSLANLCALYQWPLPQVDDLPFPLNVGRAFTLIQQRFPSNGQPGCIIAQRRGCRASLVTLHSYSTNADFYHIPLRPLYRSSSQATQRPLAELIARLFNYLHMVIGVPYLTDETYIGRTYNMIGEWLVGDFEDCDSEELEYRESQQQELFDLIDQVSTLQPLVCMPFKIGALKKALAGYAAWPQADARLLKTAAGFVELATQYPGRSVCKNKLDDIFDCEPHEVTYMEVYLSFYWSSGVSFQDWFVEAIDADLQEHLYRQEPVQARWFDRPQDQQQVSFDFESRLFTLLDELIDFLEHDDYSHEKH